MEEIVNGQALITKTGRADNSNQNLKGYPCNCTIQALFPAIYPYFCKSNTFPDKTASRSLSEQMNTSSSIHYLNFK